MGKKVAVIGGGYSGIAAAFSLSESGIPVTLFEASKTLGGRARGLDCNGLRIDNGQHILLGCYTETIALIEKACRIPAPFLRIPLELRVDEFLLRAFPLPLPFDLLFGLLFAKGLSFPEKIDAIRFLSRARNARLAKDISVAELLERNGQNGRLEDFLWKPLCISALNTPLEIASAKVFLSVLKDGLEGAGSDILLPGIDLSALLPEGAADSIRKNGGEVRTSRPARSIRKISGGFEVETDSGCDFFTQVILAVAPQHLAKLTKELPEISCPVFDYQPICTVYSRYPEGVRLPHRMTGFSRGLSQWLFDRGAICDQSGLIAAVTSAEGEHLSLSREAIALQVHQEIKQLIPDLPDPIWQKVIVEKRATFSCTVELERPDQKTPVAGFYLAGDYTAGPYPATLEGAVRSGLACARHILKTI